MIRHRIDALLNAFIAAGIATCMALLAFFLTEHYSSLDALQIAVFLGGPIAVALTLTLLLRTSLEMKINALGLLASVSTALYAGELWLAVFQSQNSRLSREARRVAESRLEIIRGLQAEGVKAYPLLHGWAIRNREEAGLPLTMRSRRGEILPLSGGVSNATIALCSEAGTLVFFNSDEHGFNNPRGIWDGEAHDLALIGDSFTQGHCVSADQHFMATLRRRYPRALNLGLTGAGPLIELAILKEFLTGPRPSTVLWFYYEGNDLDDLKAERDNLLLQRYLEPSFRQGLIEQQSAIDRQLVAFLNQVMKVIVSGDKVESRHDERLSPIFLSLTKLSTLRAQIGLGVSFPPDKDIVQLFRKILTEAKDTLERWDGTLHFVYLPTYSRYHGLPKTSGFRARNAVTSIVHDLNLAVIDLTEVFDAQPNPKSLWAHPQGHYSQEGYRLVGERLRSYLAKKETNRR